MIKTELRSLPMWAVACLMLVGCSHFHEQYIFRAGRPGKANYYRVKIDGFTAFTSSQFAAGLYDAEAVDALFGELTGTGKRVSISGTTFQTASTSSTAGSTSNTQLTLVNSSATGSAAAGSPPPETLAGKPITNQKFVFFLSSNANAFVNQIQTYVTADRMQTAVVTLLLKDDLQRLETSRALSTTADARIKSLTAAIDTAIAGLGTGDSAKSADVNASTLRLLALLASRSNTASPPTFPDTATAETWLRQHPRAFRQIGGQQ